MAATKLEKKDYYTYEELTEHRLCKSEQDAGKVFGSLIRMMFDEIGESGKDVEWAKTHDKHDDGLAWYNIFAWTKEQHDSFRDKLRRVIKKQYGYALKSKANDWNAGLFLLNYGFPICDDMSEHKTPEEFVRFFVKRYEKEHGELRYDDGYERELKERIGLL